MFFSFRFRGAPLGRVLSRSFVDLSPSPLLNPVGPGIGGVGGWRWGRAGGGVAGGIRVGGAGVALNIWAAFLGRRGVARRFARRRRGPPVWGPGGAGPGSEKWVIKGNRGPGGSPKIWGGGAEGGRGASFGGPELGVAGFPLGGGGKGERREVDRAFGVGEKGASPRGKLSGSFPVVRKRGRYL